MTTKSKFQQGSAHVLVVVILILMLITALGWIFWQNFIHQESAEKETDVVVVDKIDKGEATKPTTYDLEIKEWGLGGNYDKSVAQLVYWIEEREGNSYLYFANNALDARCAVAAITRYNPDGRVPLSVDGSDSIAAKDYAPGNDEGWKAIKGYFYQYSPAVQALCGDGSDNKEAERLQKIGWDVSRSVFNSLVPLN